MDNPMKAFASNVLLLVLLVLLYCSHFFFSQFFTTQMKDYSVLTIRPPTKQPRDTSTQVQFTHGPPPGSANKQLVVAGGGPGC
jgi:hypothetical protein